MHPFGREDESSVQDLFVFFTQCLQHGEWELAAACVRQLSQAAGNVPQRPDDIISALIAQPYQLAWETVGSPHRLAWFWLQVLEKHSKDKVSLSVRRELAFLLILEELGEEVPHSVLKELHQAFLESERVERKDSPSVPPLSDAALASIRSLLSERSPRLTHALLRFLKHTNASTVFLQHLLDLMEQKEGKRSEGWAEEVCGALALAPCAVAELEQLWAGLWRAREGPLSEERVLGCLLRPQSHTLLMGYCATTLRLSRDRLLQDATHTQVDLPEAERLMLGLCCNGDRHAAWKAIYFECLSSGKHFLEQVLVTGLDLIKKEEFSKLEALLGAEFQPLSRLLLLLGWKHCQSLDSAQGLLRILHQQQAKDTVLSEFANVLSSQLRVLEWCAKNNLEISHEALLSQLHNLDHHSALYVLHSLIPLAKYEEHRVLELLQAAGDSLAGDTQSSCVQRNITMFRGFCAMKYAVYAVCVNTRVNFSAFGSAQVPQKEQAEGPSSLFQHYLSECQLYLEAVPTMFRLELLENIFSLLFLSYSDFAEPNHSNTEMKRSSSVEEKLKEENSEREAREEKDECSASVKSAQMTSGCRGFLLDTGVMEGVLRLLREGLEGMCALGRALEAEAELAESLGCSVTVETFSARLQRLSKHTAEAQWRLQIVTTNQGNVSGGPALPSSGTNSALSQRRSSSSGVSGVRKKKRSHRHRPERRMTSERQSGEISTSTSDGSGGTVPVCVESEVCVCGGPHSWLVPSMLSPPESLLISCIRRGNYVEAHQVMLMFGLENAPCCGELLFMERYHEVLSELAQVEQKIESQSLSSLSSSTESLGSVGVTGPGRSRLGSSSRSTLQSIGNAAAAGMAFYSISDVADRLLSAPSRPLACLEENFWLSHPLSDPSDPLRPLLEELSPAGMAAFDLACCQCQLWKSSRQLLETAERRLHTLLESRGITLDLDIRHSEGIRGFPSVLQQISKILNRTTTSKGPPKSDSNRDEGGVMPPLGCSAQEVLLCSHSSLTEEAIATRLTLIQRLEVTLQTLTSAVDMAGESQSASSVLASLLEQTGLKQSELDSHPVRSAMKQLLRSLDQLCPFELDSVTCRPDYMRSFLDYINMLASVLVRSLGSEDQSSAVKLGNPLLVLLQSPHQLLSHLLFDRQVTPDRLLSLLRQEGLHVNVQQVIVQRCCEPLPLWFPPSLKGAGADGGAFCPSSIASLLHQHAQERTLTFDLSEPPTVSEPSSESEASVETSVSPNLSTSPPSPSSSLSSSSSSSASSSASSFLLTPSALSFLKSRSALVAVLALLGVSRVEIARVASSAWPGLPSYFRSTARKEAPLDLEQISKEAEALLTAFPILKTFLVDMAAPVLGLSPEAEDGVGAALSRKSGTVAVLFSGSQDGTGQVTVAEAFQQALSARDLNRALRLLELYAQNCSQKGALQDRLLACTTLEGECGTEQLFRVKDWELRARVVLQGLERWPLHSCLEMLQFCLSDSSPDHMLTPQLRQKKHELDMYRRMLSLQPPVEWQTWQELKEESSRNPESMFSFLLQTREFDLCAQWVQLYPVSEQSKLQLQTEHLLHLLENGRTEDAFQLLESLSDSLEVSERALDQRPGLAACHFLSDYLTLHFQSRMTPARRRHIHALHLGSKVLLTLPEASRQDYFQLLADPLLMLEQLLMNLKVDWVSVAVSTLRNLLPAQEAGITNLDIDTLLAEYAKKALEFPYAPREWTRSDSVISLQDALLQCPVQESALSSPSRTPPPSAGGTPMHTPSSSAHDQDRGSGGKKPRPSSMFTPPEKTPERKDWIPDHQRHICMVCQRERFTMFNRRHHCRRCGRLVCHACSSRKMVVEGCEEPVRVCDQCYSFFHTASDEELEQAEVAGSPVSAEGTLDGVLSLPEVPQRQYRLSPNAEENQQLLSEFYYEQAPSASLCVSILTLHSDHAACGHQLIGHCRSISCKLTNPEVDARLLTDVMQQLMFSAKLMFVRAGRSQDLALCDSYISKVDVLKILVSANYKYIPSLDDILETTAVMRLRNQLLEAEYYQLAVEVSTKSGLDPSGVWHAWGMALLKAGFLSAAREKFARCLKAPVDRNQLNLGSRLLQEIVQHLESTIRLTPSTAVDDDILASLTELEEALRDTAPVDRTESRVQRCGHHQECVYYLMSYGTHLSLISFYLRHDCLKDALTYLLSKECSEEVFLEGVLQPCLERGRLGVLQGLLETQDATLESWGRYLIPACQMLQRKGHYHTLYQLQQFMMDHVRAAMTCIRFFTHGAHSYVQLGEQQRWLVRAKEHLRAFLQEQQNRRKTFSSSSSSSSSTFRKRMSSNDVSRHMNTIMLQLEVTRFLHRCESSSSSRAATSPTPTGNSAPPTLFGGSSMKVEVACRVMLGGKNIEEGFGIAYRVIQDFQLDALAVYMRVGQRLVCLREYQAARQLLKCVSESGTATKHDCDTIVLSCVSASDKNPADAKELESLILESKSTENKIKAYLICSKLRAAYLLAVKLDPVKACLLVQDVLQAAEVSSDSVMQEICRQWLSEHQEPASRKRHGNNR
ncbi:zinc finger FYVE domain-containing protein 26 isoform X1 [Pangasianodon hypophthalmus]|uniref:zinc finger FYVE domain-containing protein 26 isoform X1 n=1 Tax=Pangasianodon hypophthalmus TaxID=310915 RepID=UPI0023080A63|nr:zinc finger FYVE domain-containing protein 26 isoform X1 [Pangasianodon hypophthalmus]XP_053088355.1 zinc finger FYVE domain-containing protein 26 isoform X1 [Pangasianodon hypophthalmus]